MGEKWRIISPWQGDALTWITPDNKPQLLPELCAVQAEPEITETSTSEPATTMPPAPEPKAGDYPVAVLNGTLVAGEAGRLAEKLNLR